MVKILKTKTYEKLVKGYTDLQLEILQLKQENESLKAKLKETEFALKEETSLRKTREEEQALYLMDREADYNG